MALENPGDISKPVYSETGIHILYYAAEAPAGDHVLTEEEREQLNASTLQYYQTERLLELCTPAVMPRENLLTWGLSVIYAFDTSTGVCPSLHVGYSMGILSVFLKDKELGTGWKVLLVFIVVMICLAVCFVKQHSALDVLAALPVCLFAEMVVYGKDYWIPKWRKPASKYACMTASRSGRPIRAMPVVMP